MTTNNKKTPTRVYAVTRKIDGTVRLVESTGLETALRHVAKDEYAIEKAGQKQLIAALNQGIAVEQAGVSPAQAAINAAVEANAEAVLVPDEDAALASA